MTGAESFAGFLQQAWKALLKNHPHDSICGCSIDQVHRDMQPRFEEARQIGRLALAAGLDALTGRVKHESRPTVVTVNTLAFARSAVVRSLVLLPPQRPAKDLTLVDANGEAVPTHILKVRTLRSQPGYSLPQAFLAVSTGPGSEVRPLDYAAKRAQLERDIANFGLTTLTADKPWRAIELEYLVEHAPALGYRALTLVPRATVKPPDSVIVRGNVVENKFLRVKFASDGSFDLYHKATKREYRNLNVLEDAADLGDEYDYSPAPKDKGIWSRNQRGKMKITHRSPLAVAVEIDTTLRLPVSYDRARKRRHANTVRCPVHWKFTVTAATPWVEVELAFTNLARDHRLRVRVPAGIPAQHTLTGQAFCTVPRPLKQPAGKDWRQAPAPTVPMQGFCAVEDQRRGLAVLVHGLYEYEAMKSRGGVELALTLLRAVGWLSRDDLTTRRGHAGPFYATPEAQCQGLQTFHYAIFPYAGTAEKLNLANVAESYRVPLLEEQCSGAGGNLPAQFSLLQCEPACLTITAIKRCEQRNTTIVRLYNASTERVRGQLAWGLPIAHAWRVNLAEERLEEIAVLAKSRVELDIPAWRIVTLELEAGRKIAG
ncbi:MAG: glycosyl hydrolase-related protein [candidate division KSB1 bacterium]|nr:glycosyl hydrolase-related protein [candidate division KSB1 bacterium]